MLTPEHSVAIELRCQQLDEGASCWQGCTRVRARTVDMADLAVAALDRFSDSNIRSNIGFRALTGIQIGRAASRGLQSLWECCGVAITVNTTLTRGCTA
jgi:hypothetical protein